MKHKWKKRIACTVLSLCILLPSSITTLAGTVTRNVPDRRGAITSIVTGNWGALGMEYLERAVMFGVGQAASHTDGTLSDVLSFTKRILGNPQSAALGKITELCQQISQQITQLQGELFSTTAQLEENIQKLQTSVDRNNYDGYHNQLVSFYNKYLGVYNDYASLTNALNTYATEPTSEHLEALRLAYQTIENFYNTTSDPHTGKEFNFNSDLNQFLQVISPYPATQAVHADLEVSDRSGWGNSTGSTTYLNALYTYLTDGYAFEHDVYTNMTAGINEATGYLSTYLSAYRLYVEFGAAQINSDPSLGEAEKQNQISSLWNDFSNASYRGMRGIEQMMSLYHKDLSAYMRPYDFEYTLKMNYTSQKNYSVKMLNADDRWVTCNYTFSAKKTKESYQAYQVKPIGSSTAYTILKGDSDSDSSKNNAAFHNGDFVSVAVDATWHDYRILNLDFENLKDSHSPSWYHMPKDASEIQSLLNTKPYSSSNGHLVSFLKSQGLTNLPDIAERSTGSYDHNTLKTGNFMLMNNMEWDPRMDISGGKNGDADTTWLNVTQPVYANNLKQSQVTIDVEDDIYDHSDVANKEPLVVLTGNPRISLYYNYTGNGSMSVYSANEEGKPVGNAYNGAREVVSSGQPLVAKIKPEEGKTLKSLTLSANNGAYKVDLIGNTLITDNAQATSAESILSYLEQDDEGNYLVNFSCPYQDATISAEFAEPAAEYTVHAVNLEKSSDGETQFSGNNGLLSRDFQAGEPVELNVRPYQGKLVDTVTVTTQDGQAVSLLDTTSDELRLTPTSKTYQFNMPSQDVTVQVTYRDGYIVSLGGSANGSLQFTNIGCANSEWLHYPITFAPGDTVWIESTPNSGYFVSNYTVVGNQSYDRIPSIPGKNSIRFEMPQEDVSVSAEYSAITPGSHTVLLQSSGNGVLKFAVDGMQLNSSEHIFQPGETVSFTAQPGENAEIESISVQEYSGKELDVTQDGEKYSFVMGENNVTISVKFTDFCVVTLNKAGLGTGTVRFAEDTPNVVGNQAFIPQNKTVNFEVFYDETSEFKRENIHAVDKNGNTIEVTEESFAPGHGVYSIELDTSDVEITVEVMKRSKVTLSSTSNGTIAFADGSGEYNVAGTAVQVKVTADNKYYTDKVTAVDSDGNAVEVTEQGDGIYSFVMPEKAVTVTADFVEMKRISFGNLVNSPIDYFYSGLRYVEDGTGYFIPGDKIAFTFKVDTWSGIAYTFEVLDSNGAELDLDYSQMKLDINIHYSTYSLIAPNDNLSIHFEYKQHVVAQTHTITFQYYDENRKENVVVGTQQIQHGQLAEFLNAPERGGKRFLGWFLNGKEFDWNSPIEEDIVLTAIYEDQQAGTGNNSNPATGDSVPYAAGAVALVCLSGCTLLKVKKSRERKKVR